MRRRLVISLSGRGDWMRQESAAPARRAPATPEERTAIQSAIDELDQLAAGIKAAEQEGKERERRGDIKGAQDKYNEAQEIFLRAALNSNINPAEVTRSYTKAVGRLQGPLQEECAGLYGGAGGPGSSVVMHGATPAGLATAAAAGAAILNGQTEIGKVRSSVVAFGGRAPGADYRPSENERIAAIIDHALTAMETGGRAARLTKTSIVLGTEAAELSRVANNALKDPDLLITLSCAAIVWGLYVRAELVRREEAQPSSPV
jgi:hypothetical protein